MITLTVTAFNNAPADGTLSACFDELGGTIGRAGTNQLVLPDPEKAISRVTAQVVYRNGAYAIVDRGSNPIIVNGRALGSGREAPLAAGDRLRIGGYELLVAAGQAPLPGSPARGVDDPFAGLLGPAAGTPGRQPVFDPLVDRVLRTPAPTPAPDSLSGIPSDWDPFSSLVGKRPDAAPAKRHDALGLDLDALAPPGLVPDLDAEAAKPGSLDRLFGLTPAAAGGDPLANSILDAPLAQPNMAADDDPLRSLQSAPKATAQALPDNLSDLQRPFGSRPAAQRPPTAPPPAAPSGTVAGAVMSWDTQDSALHTIIGSRAGRPLPSPSPATPKPATDAATPIASAAAAPASPAPRTAPAAAPPTSLRAAAPPLPPTEAAASSPLRPESPVSADVQALAAAFRRGLNAPELDLPPLTPELMELIGQLLHEAAAGTVDLLSARATFKRELRASATVIVPRDNNPLKHSPNGEAALGHLLSPTVRGFLPAVAAMHDAYDDLRAHQIGLVAGLQAALDGVLQRFDPAALEAELTEKTMLHTLLPSTRRARLWEVFTQHFARIRSDASEDFHSLFGHAFLKAYDEPVERMRAKSKERPR